MDKRISAKKYRRTRQNESSLQIQCVNYFEQFHSKEGFIFHIPNGGTRDAREGAKLKREGVRAGVADLCVMLSGGRVIWVEMKTVKGKQSDKQEAFEGVCNRLRHDYYICKSLDQFREIIGKYL